VYLITNDYLRVIQTSELNAITTSSVSIRQLSEGSVEAEMRSWLRQRFNLDAEFTSTDAFSPAIAYKGNQRIYLDATAYDATATYTSGQLVLQAGIVYSSKASNSAEAFNAAHWNALGAQYALFYLALPFSQFDQDTTYYKGDIVWWNNNVYTALQDSITDDQQDNLQAPSVEAINFGNVLPDDRFNGKAMWGIGIPFAGVAGILPTNPAQAAWNPGTGYAVGNLVSYQSVNYIATATSLSIIPGTDITKWLPISWTQGDNRNQMFVEMYMDMVIYNLCKRIAPNNVPEARHNAWIRCCNNLKAFAKGDLNAQLPEIQPKTGQRIKSGGKPFKEFDVF